MSAQSAAGMFAVEEFLQSLTNQLDRAQDMLAVKALAGRPLTWALRDLALELRVFVAVDGAGRVVMRSAGPNESGASTVHLNLTTVTRPMVEENTLAIEREPDPRSLHDLESSANLSQEDRRKLELAGIRTVGQLKKVASEAPPQTMENLIGIPVLRLGSLLEASSRPIVSGNEIVTRPDGTQFVRIHGANLSDPSGSEVMLGGEPAEVVEARPNMLLVRPLSVLRDGPLEVRVADRRATGFVRLPAPAAGDAEGRSNGSAASRYSEGTP